MSVDNRELSADIGPTLEEELEQLTQKRQETRQMVARITTAHEVEQSRKAALAIPTHPDWDLYSDGLGYN